MILSVGFERVENMAKVRAMSPANVWIAVRMKD
jgi:hypothetical protein